MYAPNSSRVAPWRQSYWDWRAAGNFICGGTGAGTLVYAAAAPGAARLLGPIGAVLIACGLLCVWFEIGRPWRALNVFRRPRSSWMSREAFVAPWLIATALAQVSPRLGALRFIAGALALVYLYCQARMLNAARGIPAWRHPCVVPLMIVTGLAEGAGVGVLAGGLPVHAVSPAIWPVWALAGLLLLRLSAVIRYRAGLRHGGAPRSVVRDLSRHARVLVAIDGCALAAAVGCAFLPQVAPLSAVAAVLAVAVGWAWKYAIVVRWSYNQGFALPMTPVRGAGVIGPGARPGW